MTGYVCVYRNSAGKALAITHGEDKLVPEAAWWWVQVASIDVTHFDSPARAKKAAKVIDSHQLPLYDDLPLILD